MPTARLEFSLPEEDEEFRSALEGARAFHALQDVSNAFRRVRKYEDHGPAARAMADRLEREFYQAIEGLDIWR
jgi:hypothetical protein